MSSQLEGLVERADVCVVAVAEAFRGDGEILANPIGTIPMIGGRLARATFEPELAMTDGEARLIADDAPSSDRRTVGQGGGSTVRQRAVAVPYKKKTHLPAHTYP